MKRKRRRWKLMQANPPVRRIPWQDRQHHLYRHFDKAGKLLYVGISVSALTRLSGHRACSAWFGEIAQVTIEQFANREQALQAERRAVANERPAHNRLLLARPKTSAPAKAGDAMMSIPEFCQAHGFSTALFFKLKKKGQTPRTMKVGKRTLISLEAAAAWRKQMESAGDQGSSAGIN